MSEQLDTCAGIATLKWSERRRTLAISVLPNGAIELIAPLGASEPEILRRVEKRKRWIAKHQRVFKEWQADKTPRRYVTGATHRYLGRQYRLKVSVDERERVVLRGAFFHITGRSGDEPYIQSLLEGWYRERAREQFEKRLVSWEEWCRRRSLPVPKLRLRSMPKRWGSARPDGTIQLNPELVRASSACIDYVIAHEVAHLKHPDHGRKFRSLLQSLCPDHLRLKATLEQMD